MMEALKKERNACSKLVRSQFEEGGARVKSDFQLPEPWSGVDPESIPVYNGLRRIPLLFLVDSVPFRGNEPDVPTLSHDFASYHSFYTRRFASRLGEFQLPEKGQRVHTFGHVDIRSSEGKHAEDVFTYYEPQAEGNPAGSVHRPWTVMAGLTNRLLDKTTLKELGYVDSAGVLGKHAVIMPLAHCRAADPEAVPDAIPACVEQHTLRLLKLFDPRLVVVSSRKTLDGMLRSGLLSPRKFRRMSEIKVKGMPVETLNLGEEQQSPIVYDSELEKAFQHGETSVLSSLLSSQVLGSVRKLIAFGDINRPLVGAADDG